MGRLTQSTEEIQSILDSVQDKADKKDVVQPDWDATRGKAAVKNRPFGFNNPIRLSDADEIIDEVIDPDYDTHKITYKFLNWQFEGGLLMYAKGLLYDYNYEYEDYYYNRLYSGDYFRVRDFGDSAKIEVVFDGYNYDYDTYETIIAITRDDMYDDVRNAIEEDVILAVDEVALRTSLPDIFIPDSIARQESVLELYEEASLLWDETSSLWEEAVSLNSEVSNIKGRVEELESGDGFDTKGIYPDLIAGDLAGRGESVPAEFGFRASGGKSIKDGRAYIKRIKGNSVVWNQKTDIDGWFSYIFTVQKSNGIMSWSPNSNDENGFWRIQHPIEGVQGHKYLVSFGLKLTNGSAWRGREIFTGYFGTPTQWLSSPELVDNFLDKVAYRSYIVELATDKVELHIGAYGADDSALYDGYPSSIEVHNPMLIDLTQMFQAGNEPTTVEEYEARKPIVADEYAYNEGEVIHCNTESIKSVGDNAWDEQWELGNITSNGEVMEGGYLISKNYIPALPNEQYAFNQYLTMGYGHLFCYDSQYNYIGATEYRSQIGDNILITATLPNTAYLKFRMKGDYGDTYKGDIMLTLVHSGWKQDTDAGYQEYWEDTLPLPIIRKYFPQGMKSAGSAHDEIRYNKASGKWEAVQRIGSVDMSQFGWYQGSGFWASWNSMEFMADMKKPSDNGEVANICCKKYVAGSWTSVYEATEGNIAMYSDDGRIGIADSSIQSDADIMAATQGIILYYELAKPIVTELDAEDQNFRDYYNVADFGTEQSQSSVPSAPFSADIIYQFNAVDLIRENYNEIQKLKEMLNVMQAQLISLTNK